MRSHSSKTALPLSQDSNKNRADHNQSGPDSLRPRQPKLVTVSQLPGFPSQSLPAVPFSKCSQRPTTLFLTPYVFLLLKKLQILFHDHIKINRMIIVITAPQIYSLQTWRVNKFPMPCIMTLLV